MDSQNAKFVPSNGSVFDASSEKRHLTVLFRDVRENGWLDWTSQNRAVTMSRRGCELTRSTTADKKGLRNGRQRRQEGQGKEQETKGEQAGSVNERQAGSKPSEVSSTLIAGLQRVGGSLRPFRPHHPLDRRQQSDDLLRRLDIHSQSGVGRRRAHNDS